MKKCNLMAASIFALSASLASAEGYIGVSVGQSDIDTDISDFDKATSFSIMGGYKFNPNFALEFAYVNLGDADDDFAPVWTIEGKGFNISAVGIIPANDQVDFFAKVGMFMWDATLDEAGIGEIAEDDGTDISFGVGVTGKITEQFSLALEFQRFDLDDDEVDNISLGARFYFE